MESDSVMSTVGPGFKNQDGFCGSVMEAHSFLYMHQYCRASIALLQLFWPPLQSTVV